VARNLVTFFIKMQVHMTDEYLVYSGNKILAINIKLKVMKKIITMAFAAVSLAACNNTEADNATVETDTTSTATSATSDTNSTTTSTTPDTTSTTTTTTTSSAYTAADGDVTYRDKKVRVMKGGKWVDADNDVKLDNGTVVYRNGRVKKDGKEIELKDGEVANRTGNLFDKSGRAIENAWDATKEGAKDAGKAVKEGAKDAGNAVKKAADKVGDKVGDAAGKDDKKDNN